jgi:putative copper resistance protein D
VAVLFDIFGFLAVLLRGLQLAFEAIAIGGFIFLFGVARPKPGSPLYQRLTRYIILAAGILAGAEVCSVAVNSAILVGSTGMSLGEVIGANFWISGSLVVVGAIGLAVSVRTPFARISGLIACAVILCGSVMASHAVARLEHRGVLAIVTLAHHLAGAAWIGGLLYLLIALRHSEDGSAAGVMVSRFSRLAMASVFTLAVAGGALTWAYVGSPSAIAGTTYGIMLLAKVVMTLVLLTFGALNFGIVRAIRNGGSPALLPLRRFSESEVGIGLTVLLAAASLTSTPPAVDVLRDRVTPPEIAERMAPRWPRLETPSVSELSPVTPFGYAGSLASLLPGQSAPNPSKPADIAWSEYNHHWAGLVVLSIGIFAFLARFFSWARHWPLAFFGLALFLLIRADSENWPLGPRGFWESFQVAEVAQHRLFVLLIVAFAIFEWAVQNKRLAPERAGLVFPMVCAVGGALLLTHSHSLGNVKEEFLAELSHIPLAIFAVLAGWARWLEIRLPEKSRAFGHIWPVCFTLIGVALIAYRES